jgi:UDP-N-acetylglucosamine--N-acetylmuramyl-(pentapeptide) pyrophosphoryl-undecaprenol N-acetylglucosamine transferase
MAAAGAAVVVPDSEIDADRILDEVRAILSDDGRLSAMAMASKGLARPEAAADVADEVLGLIGASK